MPFSSAQHGLPRRRTRRSAHPRLRFQPPLPPLVRAVQARPTLLDERARLQCPRAGSLGEGDAPPDAGSSRVQRRTPPGQGYFCLSRAGAAPPRHAAWGAHGQCPWPLPRAMFRPLTAAAPPRATGPGWPRPAPRPAPRRSTAPEWAAGSRRAPRHTKPGSDAARKAAQP